MSRPPLTDRSDGALALALAVTSRTHAPAADGSAWEPEGFRTPQDLQALLVKHGWNPDAAVSLADVEAARELRDRLRQLIERAPADPSAAVAILDGLLAASAPRATAALDGGAVQIELAPDPGLPLAEQLRTLLPLAVARAVERHGLGRLRLCADSPDSGTACPRAFVDTSKNGARRFCCPQCASRNHVAAFRKRERRSLPAAGSGAR